MKKYAFYSANGEVIEINVTGEYTNGCKDINVSYALDTPNGHIGNDKSFEEIDDADEIMQWLVDEGIEFESDRNMAFNRAYIQSILIDGDATEKELLDEATTWTNDDISTKLQFIERKRHHIG